MAGVNRAAAWEYLGTLVVNAIAVAVVVVAFRSTETPYQRLTVCFLLLIYIELCSLRLEVRSRAFGLAVWRASISLSLANIQLKIEDPEDSFGPGADAEYQSARDREDLDSCFGGAIGLSFLAALWIMLAWQVWRALALL